MNIIFFVGLSPTKSHYKLLYNIVSDVILDSVKCTRHLTLGLQQLAAAKSETQYENNNSKG